jgi:putative hydrolase of the HAD superfamily
MEFAKSYMQNLSNCSFLFDGSLELIENLSKNYKLLIITNGLTAVQENRIRKSIISKHFEDVVISEEISISKPNPKIFEHALENIHHTNKNTVLMVGDSLTSDIQGGINFGIDTCWYNPNKLENNSNITPKHEISNFEALNHLLLNS